MLYVDGFLVRRSKRIRQLRMNNPILRFLEARDCSPLFFSFEGSKRKFHTRLFEVRRGMFLLFRRIEEKSSYSSSSLRSPKRYVSSLSKDRRESFMLVSSKSDEVCFFSFEGSKRKVHTHLHLFEVRRGMFLLLRRIKRERFMLVSSKSEEAGFLLLRSIEEDSFFFSPFSIREQMLSSLDTQR
jgi:hypothetical protein